MKRRLQEKLVLLVRTQGNALPLKAAAAATAAAGGSGAWTFPHTAHQAGETIRQAAERALKETIGLSQV
jgi:ADP-ribose pyrophosphatase YjhB (NUDIX family)